MTEPEDFLQKLDELEAELENLNVQQKVVQPRTQKQVERLLKATREVIQDFSAWQREQQDERRLVAIIDELSKYTALAHQRLEYVEKMAVGDGVGVAFPAGDEIIKEGQWLKGMLAGPPRPDTYLQFLKDGRRKPVPSGLGVLATALHEETLASSAQQAGT